MTRATIQALEKNVVARWAEDHDGIYLKLQGYETWQFMMDPPRYKGRKLKPLITTPPVDDWGHVLQYEWNGGSHSKSPSAQVPAIWSIGANGIDEAGNGDDINNWSIPTESQPETPIGLLDRPPQLETSPAGLIAVPLRDQSAIGSIGIKTESQFSTGGRSASRETQTHPAIFCSLCALL